MQTDSASHGPAGHAALTVAAYRTWDAARGLGGHFQAAGGSFLDPASDAAHA